LYALFVFNQSTNQLYQPIMLSPIREGFALSELSPQVFDEYLSLGFRLLGDCMYRHTGGSIEGAISIPTRIDLKRFRWEKKHEKIFKRNVDLTVFIKPATDLERVHFDLFYKHLSKFYPEDELSGRGLTQYTPINTPLLPVPTYIFEVYEGDILVAVSFFQKGDRWLNGNYCIYDVEYNKTEKRSLGTFTMLLEIQFAIESGFDYYTSGYTDSLPSRFSYKKDFIGLDYYNWEGTWLPYEGEFRIKPFAEQA
jgi:leucyl-tRNA---protein transferase